MGVVVVEVWAGHVGAVVAAWGEGGVGAVLSIAHWGEGVLDTGVIELVGV